MLLENTEDDSYCRPSKQQQTPSGSGRTHKREDGSKTKQKSRYHEDDFLIGGNDTHLDDADFQMEDTAYGTPIVNRHKRPKSLSGGEHLLL